MRKTTIALILCKTSDIWVVFSYPLIAKLFILYSIQKAIITIKRKSLEELREKVRGRSAVIFSGAFHFLVVRELGVDLVKGLTNSTLRVYGSSRLSAAIDGALLGDRKSA